MQSNMKAVSSADDLDYPVICCSGRIIAAVPSSKELRRGTRTGVRSGYFDSLIVVDCVGSRIRIEGARPQGLSNPLVALGWIIGFPVTLAFKEIEILPPISLEDLKKEVQDCVSRDQKFWSEAGGAGSIVNAANGKEDFRSLIEFFY